MKFKNLDVSQVLRSFMKHVEAIAFCSNLFSLFSLSRVGANLSHNAVNFYNNVQYSMNIIRTRDNI